MKPAKIYYKFQHSHEFFRFLITDRIEINKDNLILVTGKRGSGKSTFAIKMAMGFNDISTIEEYYNKESNKKKDEPIEYKLEDYNSFDFERDITFTKKDFQDLCQNSRKGFIVSDESIVSIGRRNSMTKTNKALHQVLTINRKNCNTIFFCLPSIEDLDLSILQYVSMWVHVDSRGLGVVMLPNAPSVFGRKSWDVTTMSKIHEKFIEKNPNVLSPPNWIYDNFRGYITFGALSNDIEKKYLKLAHEKKNLENEENKKVSEKNKIDDTKKIILIDIAKKLINKEITESEEYYKYCKELGVKKEHLVRMLNDTIAEMGEGRTAFKILKDNKREAQLKEYEKNSEIVL